jgi:uncharacterized protein
MTHPQLEALRKSEEAFANGDFDAYSAFYHDDFVFHLPGRHSLAGDYTGKDAMLSLLGSFRERYSPTSLENVAIFADDEHGIVMSRATGARGDRTYEEQVVSVLRFRDRKVAELWVIPFDQAARDEWMAAGEAPST